MKRAAHQETHRGKGSVEMEAEMGAVSLSQGTSRIAGSSRSEEEALGGSRPPRPPPWPPESAFGLQAS